MVPAPFSSTKGSAMSFYATMVGEIFYPDQEDFNAVLSVLEEGGWIEKDFFLDGGGDRISKTPNIDREQRVISIPHACHRNLSEVEFFPPGAKGRIVATSTDGCFEGWEIEDGERASYDLDEWAAENIEEKCPDCDTDFDGFCDWRSMVEDEFHNCHN